ncbi:MAG: hypothetical protein AAGJ35_02595, partial [Myxococcota bacterium]
GFEALRGLLQRDEIRGVYLFGASAEAIALALGDGVLHRSFGSMEEALACVVQSVQEGDVVLLSPGCASFDAYRDFMERGSRFRSWLERFFIPSFPERHEEN